MSRISFSALRASYPKECKTIEGQLKLVKLYIDGKDTVGAKRVINDIINDIKPATKKPRPRH